MGPCSILAEYWGPSLRPLRKHHEPSSTPWPRRLTPGSVSAPPTHPCPLPLSEQAGAFLPGLSSPPTNTTSRPFPCPQGNPPSPRESQGPRTSWLQIFKRITIKNSSEQNSAILEPAQAQRLSEILRKGFLGKSPGLAGLESTVLSEEFLRGGGQWVGGLRGGDWQAQRPGSWRFCLAGRWLLRVGEQTGPQTGEGDTSRVGLICSLAPG